MVTNTVNVRPARQADHAAIHRLNGKEFGYEFDFDETGKRLAQILNQPENQLFVAELEGAVVGYVHAANYDCTYAKPLKNILAIAVKSDLQGKGIGRKLLAAIEDWALADGCAGVRLVSGHNRQQAHQFYLACGYQLRKEQKNFIKYFP